LEGLKYCLTEIEDQILIITINQPQVLNTLDRAAHLNCLVFLTNMLKIVHLRVAIITAVGDRSFCVGKNLKSEDDSGHGGV
jgi:enoyl-CoA hydratase/carnithine racemase